MEILRAPDQRWRLSTHDVLLRAEGVQLMSAEC
jgi:hypothetical protein